MKKRGFRSYVKMTLDEMPLTRPPNRHITSLFTGGLASLFKNIPVNDTNCDFSKKSDDQLELEKENVSRVPFCQYYITLAENKCDDKEELSTEDKSPINDDIDNEDRSDEKELQDDVSNDKSTKENQSENNSKSPNGNKSPCDSQSLNHMESSNGNQSANGNKSPDEIKSIEESKSPKEDQSPADNSPDVIPSPTDKSTDNPDNSSPSEETATNDAASPGKEKSNDDDDKGADESKIGNSVNDCETVKSPVENSSSRSKSPEEEQCSNEVIDVPMNSVSDEEISEDDDQEQSDGAESEKEEEEDTEYTDEDGEFVPLANMPLLAGRYKYIQVLGRGQSALIIKAQDSFSNNEVVAIKVLHKVYKPIGSQEADILLELHRADPYHYVPFIRVKTQFMYGPHYCLVFDALSPTSLYTHYELKDVRGKTSLPHIRHLAVKLLTVMGFLNKQNVIHADLKPENILLSDENNLNSAFVVDFGNALRNTEDELSLYYSDFELQTLLYRAPEVIFGLRFGIEVDMWSLGCLLAECYIGKPLFMGKTKMDILSKVSKLLGPFPLEFTEGECSAEFQKFIGAPLSRYERTQNLMKRLTKCNDFTFVTLVEQLLTYSPKKRMTPSQAACHPFVASLSPHLYFTDTAGPNKYPSVLLDESIYRMKPSNSDSSVTNTRMSKLNYYKKGLNTKSKPKEIDLSNDNEISNVKSGKGKAGGQGSRTDVKETLKSMGLRCEDFTISVYSKEQANAILKKQSQESTNTGKESVQSNANRKDTTKKSKEQTKAAAKTVSSDDDDCVILEPPVEKKAPRQVAPQYSRQFQLMGTTVQVNSRRGTKRHRQDDGSYSSNKRMHREYQYRRQQYYPPRGRDPHYDPRGRDPHYDPRGRDPHYDPRGRDLHYDPRGRDLHYDPRYHHHPDDFSDESESEESSVQDTLNRLKNYNISITCRRNELAKRSRPHLPMAPRDRVRDGHRVRGAARNRDERNQVMYVNNVTSDSEDYEFHSEDEEEDVNADMAKFLECQIGEDGSYMKKGKRPMKQKGTVRREQPEDGDEEPNHNESLDSSGIEVLDKTEDAEKGKGDEELKSDGEKEEGMEVDEDGDEAKETAEGVESPAKEVDDTNSAEDKPEAVSNEEKETESKKSNDTADDEQTEETANAASEETHEKNSDGVVDEEGADMDEDELLQTAEKEDQLLDEDKLLAEDEMNQDEAVDEEIEKELLQEE